MDERLAFDIFSAILLLAVAVLGSWLPLHLSKRDAAASGGKGGGHQSSSGNTGSKVAYHLGNCLSAGVMLSAGYCHLLADALHNLSFVGRFPMVRPLLLLLLPSLLPDLAPRAVICGRGARFCAALPRSHVWQATFLAAVGFLVTLASDQASRARKKHSKGVPSWMIRGAAVVVV